MEWMLNETITFRSQTLGSVSEFITAEGRECHASQNVLTYIAGELLQYREEGVELFPTVLFCENFDQLADRIFGAVHYTLGVTSLDSHGAKVLLKECAPLASEPWNIWIEPLEDGKMRYGLMSYAGSPTALSLQESLNVAATEFAVKVRKIGKRSVEICGSKGNVINLIFSTSRDEDSDVGAIEKFGNISCSRISADDTLDQFKIYFLNLLSEVVSNCHGTILMSIEPSKLRSSSYLSDGTPLLPPIDFYALFSDFKKSPSADGLLRLQAATRLLQGMLNSDGIVAFDRQAKAHAFRAFFKGKSTSSLGAQTGGARRRAFANLADKAAPRPFSILFRSQDGLTLYRGAEDA